MSLICLNLKFTRDRMCSQSEPLFIIFSHNTPDITNSKLSTKSSVLFDICYIHKAACIYIQTFLYSTMAQQPWKPLAKRLVTVVSVIRLQIKLLLALCSIIQVFTILNHLYHNSLHIFTLLKTKSSTTGNTKFVLLIMIHKVYGLLGVKECRMVHGFQRFGVSCRLKSSALN